MDIQNWDILSPFDPPHYDSVSGLAVINKRLISGSKDKYLKLWSLDSQINNCKHTFHLFNDYVTSMQGNSNGSIFYAGSKDGQVKACYTRNDDKI
jgi:WD40 repeat protein